MTNAIQLSDLPSRTPTHPLRAALRDDPFYSPLWWKGSMGSWWSADDARRARTFPRHLPSWLRVDEADARRRVLLTRNRETVMRVVAALDQWRTMTVQQLEAHTDRLGLADGRSPILAALWGAGLVDVCIMGVGPVDRASVLVRPGVSAAGFAELERSLTVAEWLSITAGLPLDSDRQYTRHNVLATELALRLAEYGHVGTVLGEKLSTMALLGWESLGEKAPATVHSAGDLTIVRPDGLRIVVELTATRGAGSNGKVARAVRVLADRGYEAGLAVLFVVAPRAESTTSSATMAMQVRRELQAAVRAVPGYWRAPTRERVAVVEWEELFPAPEVVVDDFGLFPAWRPTGPGLRDGSDSDVWERTPLLDRAALRYEPADPAAMRRIVKSSCGLRGVPTAARRGNEHLPVRTPGTRSSGRLKGTSPAVGPRHYF